ncbi:type II toxin-antitoxin system PemK/MazF family toxin [Halonotius sp. GCM10025705]|uniref:type II toxin-antitoxin system PemK/MazF family toxin n=1 Tax=Halonotius sp. GCM10025705 TaxID=3252678 RepID=UPI00360795B0
MTASDPVYEPGDVVYGDDPYKGSEAARPWLILSNHEGQPFHGEQYIALSLTTQTWMDGLIEIDADAWLHGGTPDDSRLIPWAVQSIDHDDIDYWQGRVAADVVAAGTDALIEYLRS